MTANISRARECVVKSAQVLIKIVVNVDAVAVL